MTAFKKIAGDSFTRFGGCLYRATSNGKVVYIQEKEKSSWKTFCIMSIKTYNDISNGYVMNDVSTLYSVVSIAEELGYYARFNENIVYVGLNTEECKSLEGDRK